MTDRLAKAGKDGMIADADKAMEVITDAVATAGGGSASTIARNVEERTTSAFKDLNKSMDDNIAKLPVIKGTNPPLKADAFEFLDKHKQEHDIIFADAPYELEGLDKIVAAVFAKKILSQDGVLVIEHSKEQDFSELPYFVNSRRYGNVNFSFFEWEEEDEDEQEVED
jgi:16S rRNA G966 N2-methylase RsmD